MGAEPVFLDTNVLVYASRSTSAHCQFARTRLATLDDLQTPLWISPQILREYVAVTTRPSEVAQASRTSAALSDVQGFLRRFELAAETQAVFTGLLDLLARFPVAGKQVHDANIVATMMDAGIRRLFTFNQRDFRRFAGTIDLEPIEPTPLSMQTRQI